jgi:hypothetical protein
MDEVNLAQDIKLDRNVALKPFESLSSDPRFADLLRRMRISQ